MRVTFALPLLFTLVLPAQAKIASQDWGSAPDGGKASLYTLTNAKGMEARISNYGGIIESIRVPDKNGVVADVVQGFDSIDGYVKAGGRYGATIGPFANRIANQTYT